MNIFCCPRISARRLSILAASVVVFIGNVVYKRWDV
jgi:hypothetical protein